MKWKGYSIRQLAAQGWETKVVFDDSILQDRQTNINEGILLVSNDLKMCIRDRSQSYISRLEKRIIQRLKRDMERVS